MEQEFPFKPVVSIVVWLVVVLVVLFNLPFTTIESTERGILYTWWAVQDSVLSEWLHLLTPFADEVRTVKVTPIQEQIDIPVNSQWSITKDNQTIWANITLFYRYKENELVNIAKNYGFETLKQKATKDVMESFKQVIGQYTIFDVAGKQEEIRKLVISWAASKIGNYPVIIDDIKISNYDWSDEFDAQIAKTMSIAQETKQQEQELKKIEVSSQQIVKQAEANRQAEALNAEALKLKGEGIRDYNQAITSNPKNMELELKLKQLEIDKIMAERWNGQRVSEQNFTPLPLNLK